MKTTHAFIVAAVFLASCASPEVAHMEGNKYFVHQRENSPGIGPPNNARIAIYAEANRLCASKGMTMKTVALEMSHAYPLKPGHASLEFECVPSQ